MESLYLLIPLSVVLVFLIGLVFWWSLRSGQFDDLEGPGYRVLMDDDKLGDSSAEAPDIAPDLTPDPASSAGENGKKDVSG
ncbi:MAG: cbb3-type cytochrome oxidase assembly protein CcoS [Propionivibrio sp.]|uniref:cbb3-type cytochrome oxidase assembly protein CcoS n=1 Tax=Propionivibrio sp. TaxID=2212460 RepID=UPI001A5B6D12|nr:cbb3-type cytochrome oxidase assembly protein CcoS [Propionivibrio sp.]MBL8416261.1 cbb3-type cytochrome oxidase assembly protein CcoS [Propionivibrio sp.]